MIELRSKKAINREYLKQDFFPHEQSNGQIVMVSEDHRYYYKPNPWEIVWPIY